MARVAARFRPLFAAAALVGCAELAYWLAPNVLVGFSDPYRTDFALYHISARIALAHGFGAVYDLDLQRRIWQSAGPMFFYPIPFTPPMVALVVPLALLPLAVAFAIWLTLMAASLVVCWALTAPGTWVERAAYLAAALAWLPLSVALAAGQVDLLVMAGVALSWLLLQRGHKVAAGLSLCVLVLKPQLAILVPALLLVAGHRKAFLAWIASAGAVGLASLVALGPAGSVRFLERMELADQQPIMFATNPGLTISGLTGGGLLGYAVDVLLVVGVLLSARLFSRPGKEARLYAIGLVASLLASPFVHVYDLSVLLPAAWLCLRSGSTAVEAALLLGVYVAGDVASIFKVMQPVPLLELGWLLAMVALALREVRARVPAAAADLLGQKA